MATRMGAERFAQETDALRQSGRPLALFDSDDVAMAARLLATAPVRADPAFVSDLRADLLARMRRPSTVRFAPLETEFGRIFVAHREGRVVAAASARDADAFERGVTADIGERPLRDEVLPAALERALRAHFSGRTRFADVDLSRLPLFQRRVLEKTAEIPRGEVRPYSWVAREIGAPGATRAVGTALGRNPIPFIIPCHRVVRADGSLGEYSGGGPEVKVKVLTFEGVPREMIERRHAALRGSRTTHIYCYPTCKAARRIEPHNVRDFQSEAAARAAGYRPCRLCRPGALDAAS